eukprot:846270-Amphidinium_carterae.1
MLLSAIVWKPRKDVMKLLRGSSQIGASNGPLAEDTEQSSDEASMTYSVPLEHGDDEGVIVRQSQQTGSMLTVLVLPEPVIEARDSREMMLVAT